MAKLLPVRVLPLGSACPGVLAVARPGVEVDLRALRERFMKR